ncbi:hypothetical protein ACIODS_12235 [Micromonospora chalcea]|uniref:hypothetical protein n=1 Tax=Micromonospora chalcea TaxID=1874 RepID=UPI0037F414C7
MSKPPTVGRVVVYTLSGLDVYAIQQRRNATGCEGNSVYEGMSFPALVVRSDGGVHINLRVFLDGDDIYWACSRVEGKPGEPGCWAWPVREG